MQKRYVVFRKSIKGKTHYTTKRWSDTTQFEELKIEKGKDYDVLYGTSADDVKRKARYMDVLLFILETLPELSNNNELTTKQKEALVVKFLENHKELL